VLPADLTVLVAVALIETGLLHRDRAPIPVAPRFSLFHQVAQRARTGALEHGAQLGVTTNARGEAGSVDFAQRIDTGISVFPANLAVLVAAPIVKTRMGMSRHSKISKTGSFSLKAMLSTYAPSESTLGHDRCLRQHPLSAWDVSDRTMMR
jgi:hypothetical protein